MSIKVLVTGANGQLGKTLKQLYKTNKDNIDFTFATKEDLDITVPQEVKNYFNHHRFHYCINCAAYTNVEQAEKTPEIAYKVNAEAVKTLAEACRDTNTVLIHISTDYVFDGEKGTPYKETDAPNPINEYGKSKLLGEQYIQDTLKQYFIIRTSWMYSNFGKNFLKTIVRNLDNNSHLKITTTQEGSPTSTYSLAGFLYFIIKNNITNFGVYHYSDKTAVSWFTFAKTIASNYSIHKGHLIAPTKETISETKRPKFSVLDNTKRLKLYKIEVLLDKSIKDIIPLL